MIYLFLHRLYFFSIINRLIIPHCISFDFLSKGDAMYRNLVNCHSGRSCKTWILFIYLFFASHVFRKWQLKSASPSTVAYSPIAFRSPPALHDVNKSRIRVVKENGPALGCRRFEQERLSAAVSTIIRFTIWQLLEWSTSQLSLN